MTVLRTASRTDEIVCRKKGNNRGIRSDSDDLLMKSVSETIRESNKEELTRVQTTASERGQQDRQVI